MQGGKYNFFLAGSLSDHLSVLYQRIESNPMTHQSVIKKNPMTHQSVTVIKR